MFVLLHSILTRYIEMENPNINTFSHTFLDLMSASLKLASLPTRALPLPSRLEMHIVIVYVTMRRF
jgi:hypothetical protein